MRARGAELTAREQAATLELFTIEGRLQRAQADLDSATARIAALAREQVSSRRLLGAARRTLRIAERSLAEQVRMLYLHEEPDALAVLLGASSFEEAIEGLDALRRSARATTSVLHEAQVARSRVARLLRALAGRRRALDRLRMVATARARALEAAQAERLLYIAQLRRAKRLNEQEIAQAAATAQAAQAAAAFETIKAEATSDIGSIGATAPAQPAPEPQPSPQAPVGRNGRTLTVVATAYRARGTTATGIPTGPGIVAVDPTVIPLGTRMTVPGYGEGVAADTGSAITGLRIDLWVRTAREAAQWQWRTVTITLH